MAKHNTIGAEGEEIAKNYLMQKGYAICATNWRSAPHEIDIVAMDGTELVIVEVKTRTSREFGEPEEFVTPSKIKNIIRAASSYLNSVPHQLDVRFDIISVLLPKDGISQPEVEHIIDAFIPPLTTYR